MYQGKGVSNRVSGSGLVLPFLSLFWDFPDFFGDFPHLSEGFPDEAFASFLAITPSALIITVGTNIPNPFI